MATRRKEESGTTGAVLELMGYCPDLAHWPNSWCFDERDLIPGEQIVAVFTPFLLELLAQGLSRKTRNLHRDNLWLLGGEIIRDINESPKLRRRSVKELVLHAVAGDEGPLIHGTISEQQQRSLDSTCKKLNRFLAAHASENPQ
jgi:hypothetical protein